MTDRPILITGADRSGTSLLYALLGSHPDVAMIRRSNVWRWFDGAFGPLSDEENFERCLDQLLRYQRLQVLSPDPDRIRREFAEGAPTYGRLFALLFRHHAERLGRARWGDKSLHTEHHADRVFAEWPEARLIQLVRDPRDRHASVVKRYPDRSKGVGAITGRWVDSVNAARTNLAMYPDRYLVVKYETLAERPVETLHEVCGFLDLEYDDVMLTMRDVAEQADEGGNSSFGPLEPGTISTRSIGRFADVLDPMTVATVQRLTRAGMSEYGYHPAATRMSLIERARLFGYELPAARTRMRAWQTWGSRGETGQGAPGARLAVSS
jgi:hypothetical protein